ncbi:unnamed protein product [Clonostachys rosea f. rosea IK726]|jgi:pimeloyl-ACP methyl ester carboxylesterase|uniref:Uncharacterized protein n=1 Tax=Clonostachys rosea f. rosea IK726 TaxID=1349383 RepID=A0ACA9THE2_BIOOC|nr:unnamed protein product [Clonostachys rosea f. rosea IK726]
MYTFKSLAVLASLLPLGLAQVAPAVSQSTAFNSSFALSKEQIAKLNISETAIESIENIINFDRSQLAHGGPGEDDFYSLPPLTNQSGPLRPGQLLKVQPFTNVSSFSIPPNTALSRIIYTTRDLNGTVLPASAFILWPFRPRKFQNIDENKAPVVLWNHGTSGFFASAAPSAHRSLWYGNSAPFTLAIAGYAVVAPDFAGLGISKSWDGSRIPHQWDMASVGSLDGLYGLRAALEAFPTSLSTEFVTIGHSQGGGVTWGVAEALESQQEEFSDLLGGYKGAIAVSPVTDVFSASPQLILPWVGMALYKLFPDFTLDQWLTPLGVKRTEVFQELEAGISVGQQLFFTGEDVYKTTYNETWYSKQFAKLANPGSKPFKGPLLVIQGTNDIYVSYNVTAKTSRDTCEIYPDNDLEFLTVQGTGHVPSLDATRTLWLDWIQSRFEGREIEKKGCVSSEMESFLPIEQYQFAGNSFIQWAGADQYSYETPLGP